MTFKMRYIFKKLRMKILKSILAGTIIIVSALSVQAQSLSDILGSLGSGNSSNSTTSTTSVIGSVLEGVFKKTNLSVSDLTGDYQAQGPAVTFKSDNFLQKAGGLAGAATIESKLAPYYEQYGLNNMTLSVDENANFVMKIKSLSLKGTITKNESEGTFDFNFNVMGINLGKFTAYIEKSGSNLYLMFDATKLKSFISAVAKFTGNSMATALGSILDSYEGACIGWKMVSTSQSEGTGSDTGSAISNGLNSLKDILNGGK